ncbi:MAG: SRPBCC domain-containing protein [Aeromicrobium sp.]|uniref:SRPBCC family protein n=1 Tax=Aeromicrobium sp. TaxID=1871063 RepID=UPI0039E344E0
MELNVTTDHEAHRITVVSTFEHPLAKVWDLYADPRKLERWWGPPTYPATVVRHELRPGGVVHYFMTSPEGEKYHGLWHVDSVEPQASFAVRDLFADDDGEPLPNMPVATMRFAFDATDTGARVECVTQYASAEALAQVVEMGMEEGMRAAMGQMEDVLAED